MPLSIRDNAEEGKGRKTPMSMISVFERWETDHASDGAAVIGINNVIVKSIGKKCIQKFNDEYPGTAVLGRLDNRWGYVHSTSLPTAVTCSRADASSNPVKRNGTSSCSKTVAVEGTC
jgi:hypothetical protein